MPDKQEFDPVFFGAFVLITFVCIVLYLLSNM